jgi:hypothetical protein
MWQQYKRTLPFVQATILVVSVWIYLTLHHLLLVAALFFAVMQLAAVLGAIWAARLKATIEGAALPPSLPRERIR